MAVSLGEHGCGATHTRPVTHGAPAKVFKLDCPPCESHLKGDGKPSKLVYELNKSTGAPVRQARVPDADPMWSSTPDTIPLTPDEARVNEVRQERGAQQIQMIQALAALRSTGIELPPEALWLLERELPAGVLRGTVVCLNGHDVPSGSSFCPQCGASMAARGAIGSGEDESPIDLSVLHVATLRKMCRDHKPPLSDKGTKDQMIDRLKAA